MQTLREQLKMSFQAMLYNSRLYKKDLAEKDGEYKNLKKVMYSFFDFYNSVDDATKEKLDYTKFYLCNTQKKLKSERKTLVDIILHYKREMKKSSYLLSNM